MWGTPHWGPQTAWWMSQQTRLVTPAFGVSRTPVLPISSTIFGEAKRLQIAATEGDQPGHVPSAIRIKPEANPLMGCEISTDSSGAGPQTTSGQKTTVGLVADPSRRACPNESVGECTSCRVRDALHVQNVTRLARSNQRTILKMIDDLATLRSEVTLLRKENEQLGLQVAALAQISAMDMKAQVPQTQIKRRPDTSEVPSLSSVAPNEATIEDKENKGSISYNKIKISSSSNEPIEDASTKAGQSSSPPTETGSMAMKESVHALAAEPGSKTADVEEESESLSDWERASSSVSPVTENYVRSAIAIIVSKSTDLSCCLIQIQIQLELSRVST